MHRKNYTFILFTSPVFTLPVATFWMSNFVVTLCLYSVSLMLFWNNLILLFCKTNILLHANSAKTLFSGNVSSKPPPPYCNSITNWFFCIFSFEFHCWYIHVLLFSHLPRVWFMPILCTKISWTRKLLSWASYGTWHGRENKIQA